MADLTHGTANGWNYYNSGYATVRPNYTWETGFGAEEQNGTYDMMGNVLEWNESAWDGNLNSMSENRTTRGGAYFRDEAGLRSSDRYGYSPGYENYRIGFRVAAIPEPSSLAMIGLVSGCAVLVRKRFLI